MLILALVKLVSTLNLTPEQKATLRRLYQNQAAMEGINFNPAWEVLWSLIRQ